MNIIRDSFLAKITRGGGGGEVISSGFGHMVAIIMRINTQALMCSQIIHMENLLHIQHSRYIFLQGNNQTSYRFDLAVYRALC